MEIIEKFLQGKYDDQELCEDGIVISENFIAVIDGFNHINEKLMVCVDLLQNTKEIVFTSDGYIKPFFSLKETEEYLKYVKNEDPLRIKKYPYEKAFIKGKSIYDDRAYIRFKI